MTGESDMREVWKLIHAGDANARDAMDVYLHRLTKYVGAYTAVMGGLDAISFTAGVGENDKRVREGLCERLAFMGVKLDPARHPDQVKEPTCISADNSAVAVFVYPTNEEFAIARQAMTLI